MRLFQSILRSVLVKRDLKLFLAFGVLPALVPLLANNMETVKGDYTSSFLSFLQLAMKTQYQLVLPTLIFSLLIASVFRDEIDAKILFLYKDLSRQKIFHAKILALATVYALFFLVTTVFSLLVYYFWLVPRFGVSSRLLAQSADLLSKDMLTIGSLIFLNLVSIMLVAAVSIHRKTLVAILAAVFFNAAMLTAPFWVGLNVISPLTYADQASSNSALGELCSILILALLYIGFLYWRGKGRFRDLEF